MARVKRAVNAHKKRRVVLERASGYRGQRSRLASYWWFCPAEGLWMVRSPHVLAVLPR